MTVPEGIRRAAKAIFIIVVLIDVVFLVFVTIEVAQGIAAGA